MKHRNGALYLVLIIVSLAVTIAGVSCPRVRAQQPNQVGLVVDFGNGTVVTRCVEFTEPEIKGYDVLRRSGLRIVADEGSGMGVTICDIGSVSGCSASNCFCRCQGMTCMYWTYYSLEGGSWRYSPLGASAHTVQHGDVEGWAWGEGNPSGGAQPPVLSLEQICAGRGAPTTAGPPPSPTHVPTLSPTPTAPPATMPPPSPVATVISSSKPSPTVRPTLTPSPTLEATERSSPRPMDGTATPASLTIATRGSALESGSAPSSTTPMGAAQVRATTPPDRVAGAEGSGEGSVAKDQAVLPTDDDSPSPPSPIGYIAFGLIAAGLLGWLIYTLKFRGQRA